MDQSLPITKFQKFLATISVLPLLIGGVFGIVAGILQLVIPPSSTSRGEECLTGIIAAISGTVGSMAGCMCLQIIANVSWPTRAQALVNRNGLKRWLVIGPLLFIVGIAISIGLPPAGVLFVLGGILVSVNAGAALVTGLPWKLVFNSLAKNSVNLGASEVIDAINPLSVSIGEIEMKPELISVSPEYQEDGSLKVVHLNLPLGNQESVAEKKHTVQGNDELSQFIAGLPD